MAQRIIPCNNCGCDKHKLLVKIKGNRGANFIAKRHRVVICENCGLIFLNPQYEAADYEKFYSCQPASVAKTKSLEKFKKNYRRAGDYYLKDFLLENIDKETLKARAKLLDIGCGHGTFLYFFKDENFELFGLEPGKGAVEFGRQLGLNIIHGTLEEVNLPENNFDIIVSLATIEHVNDPLGVLKKMQKLLKPGGYLLLTTPDFREMVLRRGIGNYFKFVHTFYFTGKILSSLLKQAGFDVLKVWSVPAEIKNSTLFNPMNCKSGLLHIFARKSVELKNVNPEKDSPKELIELFQKIKKRDRIYYFASKILFLWNYIKSRMR